MPTTPDPIEIDRLVIAAQGGDHRAFHALVVVVQRDLRLVLCGFAPPPQVVEELVQDTLVTAWERLGTYRPEGTFQAWLHAIARNKARARWRSARRAVLLDGDAIETMLVAAEEEILADEDATASNARRLAACLELLPERTRQLLQRRYVDGTPLVALSGEVRQTEQALAALFYRLRGKLRECMAKASA